MIDRDGATVTTHEGISDLIAEQLSPGVKQEGAFPVVEVEGVTELNVAIRQSPANTGPGFDEIGYPMIYMWARKDMPTLRSLVDYGLKHDIEDWHYGEVVLIPKADKPRYDVVKSWRMIHLLPTIAKVAECVMLGQIAAEIELGPTQFRSQRRKGCHDMMAMLYEFLEYYKGRERGLMSMDIESWFDKIDSWQLCQLMAARGYGPTLCWWVARWASRRSIKFQFNGRLSREYNISQGIPQGSPLSPFLFGIYVVDILSPCLLCSPSVASVVLSYVDDGLL